MAPTEQSIASQLAILTGLDDASVKQQLLPYIQTLKSATQVTEHLRGLLGDDAKAKAVIEDVLLSTGHIPAAAPATRSNSSMGQVGGSDANMKKPKGKGKKKVIGLVAPRRVTGNSGLSHQVNSSGDPDALNSAFGEGGTIYRKDMGFDELEAKYASRMKAKQHYPASSTSQSSAAVTPNAPLSRAATPPAASEPPSSMVDAKGKAKAREEGAGPPKEKLAPTPEILDIMQQIADLTVSPSSHSQIRDGKKPTRRRICFCAGRTHPPHPDVPLCPSCHLIICSKTSPSPLNVAQSSCPSCGYSPLLSSSQRESLLAELLDRKERLEDEQRERVRLLRLERERDRELRKEEASTFPDLAAIASPEAVRLANAQSALGRGSQQVDAQQRTHKVFSLNMKTHKITEQRAKPKAAAQKAVKTVVEADQIGTEAEEEDVTEILVPDPFDEGWGQFASPVVPRRPDQDEDIRALLEERPWANWKLGEVQLQSLRYVPPEQRRSEDEYQPPSWSFRAQHLEHIDGHVGRGERTGEKGAEDASNAAEASNTKRLVPGAAQPPTNASTRRAGKSKGKYTKKDASGDAQQPSMQQ